MPKILKSRTVWTLVALVVLNGVGSIHDQIPAQILPCVDLALGFLGMYFRANPRQEF